MLQNNGKSPKLGVRHLQILLLFTNMVVLYISRLNVSVSVVAMTNAANSNANFPEYNWNEKQKSYIISSFYWGYVITQIPGGYWVRRYGVKINLFIATLSTAIFSLITPFCIHWGGWQIYCVLRILQGLFQGALFPCIQQHLAKWSPPEERNRLGVISYSGFECGTVLAMAISGLIAEGPMGWPGISYISALICFVWCLLWLIFGANEPTSSKFITKSERDYIETSLQLSTSSTNSYKKPIPIPWRAILTSVPFYALLVVRSAQSWGLFTIQTEIPSYMNSVLKFNIRSNALYSALPYLASWLCSYIYMIIAEFILNRNLSSLTILRKALNSIGMWIPAIGMIGVSFLGEQEKNFVIILLTTIVGINSGTIIGSSLSTIDLAPNHTGITVAIVNMVSNMVLMATPLFVGVIVTNPENPSQWQIVFITAGVVFCIGGLIFIIWGSAKEQPWNELDYDDMKTLKTTTAFDFGLEKRKMRATQTEKLLKIALLR